MAVALGSKALHWQLLKQGKDKAERLPLGENPKQIAGNQLSRLRDSKTDKIISFNEAVLEKNHRE